MLFRNHEELLSHGLREPRELALRVAAAGLAACDPGLAVEGLVRLDGEALVIGRDRYELEPGGRVVVLGAGKASLRIALALERLIDARLDGGAVVVRDLLPQGPLGSIDLLEASHPIPDERSVAAAQRLLELAAGLGERDIAIACFTGGSSALASLPPAGVSSADKRELHRLLLGSGMAIGDVNTVRKQVSGFKGGRLAAAVAPARLINLTVSDVAGDTLDALTDPSVQNRSTVADAVAIVRAYGLWDSIPESVRSHLERPGAEVVDLSGAEIHSTLLVTGETACEAMLREAEAAGAAGIVLSTELEEEAAPLGRILGQLAAGSAANARPFHPPCVLVGCGGECTVRLSAADEFGRGGPNQEAALAAVAPIESAPVALVLLDTDGSDGGTDVAGAICDGATARRARESCIELREAIARHRSGEAIARLGDGIYTGPTHTNVNDLFVIAIASAPPDGCS